MVKTRNNGGFAKFILHIAGLLVCALPPIICTLSYFPLWISGGGEQMISGGAALLIILAALPFYKFLRKKLESAASYIVWLFIFLFCFLMAKIIDQVTVISFVGLISNLIGAVLLKIGEKLGKSAE